MHSQFRLLSCVHVLCFVCSAGAESRASVGHGRHQLWQRNTVCHHRATLCGSVATQAH